MDNNQKLLSDVASVIREILDQPELAITPATTASDVRGWDSLKQVKILMAVEERFDISFRSREIDKITNVGELLELISIKRSA